MNFIGSGLITILIYANGAASPEDQNTILTENNLEILAESGDFLQTE